MSMRKAIFFDIDGTLWDWNNEIPKSTVQALYSLRKNGHLTFLCSRTEPGLYSESETV